MSKTMSQTIRGHNLRVTMVVAALAAMLLVLTLVVVVQTSPTTGGSANHAMSADGSGGSSITQDPYIERHAEVVARHHGVIPHY